MTVFSATPRMGGGCVWMGGFAAPGIFSSNLRALVRALAAWVPDRNGCERSAVFVLARRGCHNFSLIMGG
jgi:hypothetical protein